MHVIDGQADTAAQAAAGSDIIRVSVVDDDPAVRDALKTILELEGFVVLTCQSGDEILSSIQQSKPDCVLLDVHMPGRSGMEVLEAISRRENRVPVIMISGLGDIATAVAAIKAGAYDFIEKPFDADAVIEVIRKAVRAHRTRPAGPLPVRRFAGSQTLTPREREVLEGIIKGLSNKETGRVLGISPRTIEVHRGRIMEKASARNTADLMRIVFSTGSAC